MTTENIPTIAAELLVLEAQATPQPWDDASKYPDIPTVRIFSKSHYIGSIGNSDDTKEQTEANAALIAAMRNAIVPLCRDALEHEALKHWVAGLETEVSANNEFMACMTGELAEFPCCHGKDGHGDTPPMMWPELIRCIIKHALTAQSANMKAAEEALKQAIAIAVAHDGEYGVDRKIISIAEPVLATIRGEQP